MPENDCFEQLKIARARVAELTADIARLVPQTTPSDNDPKVSDVGREIIIRLTIVDVEPKLRYWVASSNLTGRFRLHPDDGEWQFADA